MEWRYIGLVFFFLLETLTAQEGYNYPTPSRPLSGRPVRPGGLDRPGRPDKQPGQGITSSPDRDYSIGITGPGQDYSGPQGKNGYPGRQYYSARPKGPGKTYLAPESAAGGYENEKQSTGRKNGFSRVPGNQGYPNEQNYPSQQQSFSNNQRETTQGYPSQNQQANKQNYPGSSISDNPQGYPSAGSTKNYPSRPVGTQTYSEVYPGPQTDSPQEGSRGYPKQQGSTEGYQGSQNYPGQQTDSPQPGYSRGYPKQQGSTQGYRKQQGVNQGYPGSQNYPGQQPDSPQEGTRGYPKQQGSTQGYPKQQGGNGGYPGSQNYPGQQTDSPQEGTRGYPKQQGSTQGYPKQQGGNGGYPGSQNYPGQQPDSPQEGTRGYPKQQGSTQGYPKQQGGNGGYPGSQNYPGQQTDSPQEGTRGYPKQQGSTQGYPEQQGGNEGYPGSLNYPGQRIDTPQEGSRGYNKQQGNTQDYPGQQTSSQGYPSQQSTQNYPGEVTDNQVYSGQRGDEPSRYNGQPRGPQGLQGQENRGQQQNGNNILGLGQESFPGQQDESSESYDGDYSAIPGEPDKDYPIFSEIPQTSFSCDQQQYPGYYADVETRCQVFHICANNKTFDFLCPNGTIFHQQYLVCVWWNQFDCDSAPSLYELNANIYDYSTNGGQGFPPVSGGTGGYPEDNNQGSQRPGGYPNQIQDQGYSSQLPSGPQRVDTAPTSFQQEYPRGGPDSTTGYPSGYSNTDSQRPQYTNGRPNFTPRPNQEPSVGANGYSSLEPGFPSTTTTETSSQDGGNGYSNGRPGTSISGVRPQSPTRGYLPPFQ